MGIRKNAAGEWVETDNKVPQGLVDAMRGYFDQERVSQRRSQSIIKKQPNNDSDGDEDAAMVDAVEEGNAWKDEPTIDVADSAVIFEEIRVYLDVERGGEGAHVYVDDNGIDMQTILRSVEAKSDVKIEVKMGFEEDMLDDSGDMGCATIATRGSLASITEADEGDEKRMDLDSPQQAEQQPGGSHQARVTESTPRTAKRRRKWSESETKHVGAWLDAGYKTKAILDLFERTIPDAERITAGMVGYRRSAGVRKPNSQPASKAHGQQALSHETEPKPEAELKREGQHQLSSEGASMAELAPIQTASPKVEKSMTLPSLSEIGLETPALVAPVMEHHSLHILLHSRHYFRRANWDIPSQTLMGPPPISPPENYRAPLPSSRRPFPGRPDQYYSNYNASRLSYAPSYGTFPSGDYSSSATETPSTNV